MEPSSARRLIVFVKRGVELERLLLHLEVVVEGDQIPIEVDHVGYGGDHLLLELQIRDAQIILGHIQDALVDGDSEPVQEVLGDGKVEAGLIDRIEQRRGGILIEPEGIAGGELHSGTRPIALLDAHDPALVRGDKAVVPVMAVVVSICVWCAAAIDVKNVGSRFGIADPANCTFTPLKTPLLLLPDPVPPPVVPTVLDARTPSVAELGPEVILVERLRSNWPADAR